MDRFSVVFMIIGVVIVVVVGRLLTLTGRRYVGGGHAGSNVGTVATLLSTVFHLVTLGLTALIAVLPFDDDSTGLLTRLGILLIVVGAVYGIFVGALARRREVAITEAAVDHNPPPGEGENQNPNVPGHAPSYLPPSGLPGSDGT